MNRKTNMILCAACVLVVTLVVIMMLPRSPKRNVSTVAPEAAAAVAEISAVEPEAEASQTGKAVEQASSPSTRPTSTATARPWTGSANTGRSTSSYSSFSNKYGTPTTRCAHSGCSNYIASSGDTNCCTAHSRRCLQCGKYIDEDATYCMDCLRAAFGQ